MYSIHVANEQHALRVNRPRLVQLAQATLASERVRAAEISVALVDDVQIHTINREFLGHDYPTDVISFLLESDEARSASAKKGRRSVSKSAAAAVESGKRKAESRLSAFRFPLSDPQASSLKSQPSSPKLLRRGAGKSLGGEIIISVETAVTMAGEYGWRPVHELSLYLVHGLLHLCGYDDLTPDEQRLMRQREVEVLASWKIVPHYAE